MPTRDPAEAEALAAILERVDVYALVSRSLEVGIPRLDPKTRETVARNIALRIRLALTHQEAADVE